MKVLAVILAAVLAGALPWITSSNYIIGIALSACIFTVAAAALNLVYGYTGMLSFAQLGFWGIGGYATALTVMTFGGNFWMGLVWAALINARNRSRDRLSGVADQPPRLRHHHTGVRAAREPCGA